MQIFNPAQNNPCSRCGYSHPYRSCPAFNCKCYNCHNTVHFTAPCRRLCTGRLPTILTGTENLEEGPADLAVIEDQASHLVGEGRHTETTPTAPSSSGPVTAPHRMVAEGDSSDVEDIIPHHTGTRPSHIMSFDSNNEGQL